MSTRITCPNCGRYLLLPEDRTAEAMSCPRCLARIDNRSVPPPASAVQAETPLARSSSVTGSQSASPGSARAIPGVDVDVRRDSGGTVIILVVLVVLGILGFLGTANSQSYTGGLASGILMLGAVALILLLAIRALHRANMAPRASTVWTVFRALAISGIVGILLVIAGVIFLLGVCIANGPWLLH